tara:strand:- start:1448 stop:1666 length:219 start_codon:yes stop_codon:yes gene_type:complete
MCGGGGSTPPTPPPPPAPNRAPDEIENAVDSPAETQKKKRKGSKQLRRGNRKVATATTYTESAGGTGLTIKK